MKRKKYVAVRIVIPAFVAFIGFIPIGGAYRSFDAFYIRKVKFSRTLGRVSGVRWSGRAVHGVSHLMYTIRYQVRGVSYECRDSQECGRTPPSISDPPTYMKGKEVMGSPVVIYYDPVRPYVAFQYIGDLKGSIGFMTVGCFCILCAIALFVHLWRVNI